ncbi:MAG: hypothetical protein AABZ80_05550 [Gemmatimonadota bacterium]
MVTVLVFAAPLFSLQVAYTAFSPVQFVSSMQSFGALYSIMAAVAGLLVALSAWRLDHAGHHVYALALPLSRARYAAYRFTAGLVFLLPIAVGLLIGCLLVAISGLIPDGLHAYPIALTLRFTLAALVAYAVFFAISAATNKTAGMIIGVIASLFFAQYLLNVFAGNTYDILEPTVNFIFVRPGILSVFAGRWMLVDA